MWLSHLKDAQDKYKEAAGRNPENPALQSSPGSPRGSLIPGSLRPHTLLDRTRSSPSRTSINKSSPGTPKREVAGGSSTDARGAQGAVNQAASTTTLAEIVIQEHDTDCTGAVGVEAADPDAPPPGAPPAFPGPSTSTAMSPGPNISLLRPRSRTPTETKSISPPPTPGRPRSRDRSRRLNTLKALHEKAKSMDIVFIWSHPKVIFSSVAAESGYSSQCFEIS